MTYALILSGTITAEGNLPKSARKVGTGQWITPPDGVWTDAQAAECGWLPVVDATRPVDTATKTSDRTLTIVAGKPTVVWTVRDKTPAELHAEQVTAAQAALDAAVPLAAAPTQLEALQRLNIPPDGSPWRAPSGVHDAYPVPSTCTHKGKTWENLTPANVWEPPTSWREIAAPGGLPEWVQPTGSADAYSFGDKVAHNGHKWTNTNPGTRTNTWEPGVYGWRDDGPA